MKDLTITVSKRLYDELLDDSEMLRALRNHGVDNWEGYDEAIREYHDHHPEEE